MKTKNNLLMSTAAFTLCAAALLFAPHSMAAPKDTLNASDVKFVREAGAGGIAELKLAVLGAQKASRADIKAFAEQLVTDHTKANEELKKLAETKGVELSAVIDPTAAASFQKMEKYSGAEFDKEFISEMVNDHKKCVASFEAAAKDSKDGDVKAFAEKMLPTLKAHHDKAVELASK